MCVYTFIFKIFQLIYTETFLIFPWHANELQRAFTDTPDSLIDTTAF
jgi:hypothetical protein